MNKNKNIVLVISLLSAIIVFAENYLNIFDVMVSPDDYTLFVLFRSVAVLGMSYVAYLCFVQNKKGWFWTIGLTTLWIHASLVGGSISLIPTILNLVAMAVLVVSIFKLKLSVQNDKGVI